jgi:Domain of unknown function (DUF397)
VGIESAGQPTWRIAKRCDGGQCVEIGILGEVVMIRDSADPYGIRIVLSHNEWREFVASVKDGV